MRIHYTHIIPWPFEEEGILVFPVDLSADRVLSAQYLENPLLDKTSNLIQRLTMTKQTQT